MRKHIGLAALAVAFSASGCGGGSSSSPSVVPTSGKTNGGTTAPTAKAKLTIKIPLRKHVASGKVSPQYISPATSGLYIRAGVLGGITSSTPWQSFDVTPASSADASPVASQQCVADPATAVVNCTVTVTAPAVPGATDEFQIIATDWGPTPLQTNVAPIGLIDSAADDTGLNGAGESIAVGSPNAVNVALEGFIGNLIANPTPPLKGYSVWAAPGKPTTFDGYISAADADFNPISGNPPAFANPIVLSDNLGSASPFTYPAPSVLAPTPTGTVIYAPITYLASVSSIAAATVVNVTTALPAWITPPTAPKDYNPQNLQPTATFEIDPMTVTEVSPSGATPIGTIDLSNGDASIVVDEQNITGLTVTENPPSATIIKPVITVGSAQFTISASDPSTSITIVDDRGTSATLPVSAAPATLPVSAAPATLIGASLSPTAIRHAKR